MKGYSMRSGILGLRFEFLARCHSRESGNPESALGEGFSEYPERWIPAFAGMTLKKGLPSGKPFCKFSA
jgi:hypothetical protein